MSKLTKKEQEQDSIILGAIIAGATKKPLITNESRPETSDSVCAIGAGIIGEFIGEKIPSAAKLAIELFADIHGVSIKYAEGVNDGFEQDMESRSIWNTIPYTEIEANEKSKDYCRGWNVGETANTQRDQRNKSWKK